jgi:hypothetical protein
VIEKLIRDAILRLIESGELPVPSSAPNPPQSPPTPLGSGPIPGAPPLFRITASESPMFVDLHIAAFVGQPQAGELRLYLSPDYYVASLLSFPDEESSEFGVEIIATFDEDSLRRVGQIFLDTANTLQKAREGGT